MSEELTSYLLISKNSRQALIRKAQDSHTRNTNSKQSMRGLSQNHNYEQIVKVNLDRVFKIAGNNSVSVSNREKTKLAPIKEKSHRIVNSILSNGAGRYSNNPKGIRTFTSPLYRTIHHHNRTQITKTAQIIRKTQSPPLINPKPVPHTIKNFSITQTTDKRIPHNPRFVVIGSVAHSRLTSRYSSRQSMSSSPHNLNSSFSYSKPSLSSSPASRNKSRISRLPDTSFLLTSAGVKNRLMPIAKPAQSSKQSSKQQIIYKVSRLRLKLRDELETPILGYRSYRNSRI